MERRNIKYLKTQPHQHYMVRKPIAAGMFYEELFELLDKQISECFTHAKGPGALPAKRTDREILGIIAPHAGYQFSGPCQAWAYKEIAESKFPDIFIILGTNHQGFGKAATLLEDFETPLGIVKTDIDFAKKLIKNSDFNIVENKELHAKEHSIEVQLPFLQFANKDNLNNIRIVPIITGPEADYKKVAETIIETAKKENKKIIIIASSDFTHYGFSYGFVPFQTNIKENLYKLDKEAIKHIEKLDAFAFLDYVKTTETTICGAQAIAIAIKTVKALKAKKAKLLQYYTSGDIVNDYRNAVGYASILFK